MDSADMCAAVSSGDGNQPVKNKKDWHKRLRLRKTAIQSPTMQGRDKHRPKKIAKRQELNADCPPSNMPPNQGQRGQRKAHNNPSTLRFKCSQCNDNLEFVPKELVRHFQENHKGNRPDFCCHICSFRTHELSYLQVHLLSHKDSFLSCNICKDNIQRTLPEYCSHLTSSHSQEGNFSCELCDKFSTGEVHVYLQHMYLHDLPTDERGEVDLSLHTKDFIKPVRSKASGQGFQCPYCVYKGPSKRLITKHMNTVHAGQTVNENMKEPHHIKINQHELAPKMRNRVTRNTARDMHWLSKDCLSLQSREFLDKYCCLSNPERTLEETQQYLVRSAVGEKDGQKWTKALQTVLSKFPQDLNMHQKLDNAMISNSSKDHTVLMVQNKLPQKAGPYVKKTTPSEKLETSPSGSASPDTHCVLDPNRDSPQLGNDQTHCPGTQDNISGDSSIMAIPESGEGGPIQENRENQELRLHQNVEEHGRNCKEIKCDNSCEDGLDASKEPKMGNKRDNRRSAQRKCRSRRSPRMGKTRPKALEKQLQGLGLKLVLKKDPVKNKQWMSQSPLLPPDGCLAGDHHGLLSLPAMEKQGQTLANGLPPKNCKVILKECCSAPKTNLDSTLDLTMLRSQPQPVEEHFSETHGLCGNRDVHANVILVPSDDHSKLESQSSSMNGFAENLDTAVATFGVSGRNNRGVSHSAPGRKKSSSIEDMNPFRINGAVSSHAAETLIPSPGASPAVCCFSSGRTNPSLLKDNGPPGQTTSEGPTAASQGPRLVAQRAVERTLKLTPLSPSQAVKRPRGRQPVVVLNHPDADGPEVARLMEAVHKHRGDVQRVVLSRRTLDAIATAGGLAVHGPPASGLGPDAPPPPSSACRPGSVRERFLLKLRLRRTSRRKYQVIRAAGDRTDAVVQFRCWFCGRVFVSQDLWIAHRQRHFMEWKRPNCEKAETSPTLKKYTKS